MTASVVFTPEAEEQLVDLYRYIAAAGSPEAAARYTDSIVTFCEELATFPYQGRARDDIRPGLRLIGYRRRVVVAFAVTGLSAVRNEQTAIVFSVYEEHRDANRALWNERASAHAASPDYSVQQLIDDPEMLSNVVRFDLPRLGDITGLRGVHLQCHIGTDTISLARLGARMTGLDFSPASIEIAREIATAAGIDVDYVESDVYSAPTILGQDGFDLVYTGVGALIWLPDMRGWAEVVAQLLRPGGRLFLREGHPVLWALDEERTDALALGYPYFEHVEPIRFDASETYVETDAVFDNTESREWNHGLGEIVTALLDVGLELTMLVEHDSVPWEALPGRMHSQAGEWRLDEHSERLPLSYTLQAVKKE